LHQQRTRFRSDAFETALALSRILVGEMQGYSGFAIGVDRSEIAFRGFLSRKTTPRELFGTTVIAKPL
jgi:hypothetical protein